MHARLLLFAAVFALAAPVAPARAEGGDWGEGIEVMSDAEMSEARGGVAIMPNVELQFGAVIITYVSGEAVLRTQLTWTEAGRLIQSAVGQLGGGLALLTPEARAELGLLGLANAEGLMLNDEDGVTLLVHNIEDGALQNIVFNTGSNRDLRQEIDVTLALSGFDPVQDSIELERIGLRLDQDMRGLGF